jgi:hypothetical protein
MCLCGKKNIMEKGETFIRALHKNLYTHQQPGH